MESRTPDGLGTFRAFQPVFDRRETMARSSGRTRSERRRIMRRRCSLALAVLVSGLLLGSGPATDDPAVAGRLARVREIHGAAGPWAVAGYRIGERALKELGLPRHSFSLLVIHHAPAEVQFSCVADGLQASTGASPGKLNLRVEEASAEKMCTVVRDRKTGRTLTFTLRQPFVRSIADIPHSRLEGEGRRVASLPDDEIFSVERSKSCPDR